MGQVWLKELAEQMDFMLAEWRYFVDQSSGKIISIEERFLTLAEEPEGNAVFPLAEWERDELKQAEELLKRWGKLIPFPDKQELDEYGIMEEFSESQMDSHIRECLCIAIEGKGAFRRFKNAVNRLGIAEQWYRYKEEQLLEFARSWCKENEVPYIEKPSDGEN